MLKITKHFKVWFAVSGLLSIAAIVAIALYGLKPGIDFTGGSILQMGFENRPEAQQISKLLVDNGVHNPLVQPLGEKSFVIRTAPISHEEHLKLSEAVVKQYPDAFEEQYSSIGPVIGKELRSKALMQLILVSSGIIFYIAYAFRKITKPVSSWQFGVAAIIALLHDLLIVIGVFAVLGHYMGVEIDSLFITALLTVLGFSVHDTIVVFDRIRENMRVRGGHDLGEVVDSSISQTLVRSINTSVTVMLVLAALLLFGGESIRYFVLALLIGIGVGTYSSIFIASPILIIWQNWKARRAR